MQANRELSIVIVNYNKYELTQNVGAWMQGDFSMILKGNYEILYITVPLVILAYVYANRFMDALGQVGFTIDMANSQLVHRSMRYICMINDGVQIVIENNGTKYFWITFYVTGDWTLR